jgi:hypothetical protein
MIWPAHEKKVAFARPFAGKIFRNENRAGNKATLQFSTGLSIRKNTA